MNYSLSIAIAAVLMFSVLSAPVQAEQTFAERLGWKADDIVLILHTDDAGMSHSSNLGAIEALENGVGTSVSTMMPCGWVPEFAAYLKKNPKVDNGLHLTLTSEWKKYRWAPLAGRDVVPGLVDEEGAMWHSVMQVAKNTSPDEFEAEIRAQIARAEALGMPITHYDTHMGTVFATPEFIERYVKIGIEKQVPIMIPGGHLSYIRKGRTSAVVDQLLASGVIEQVWDAGLPVIDDLVGGINGPHDNMADNLIEMLKTMKPGITQIINHASRPTDLFKEISSSGGKREEELEYLLNPRVKEFIEDQGIILTTWRELKERRDAVGAK